MKVFRYVLLLGLVTISSYSYGQKAPKFGLINTQDLIQVMPDRDSAQKKMEAFTKELDANIETLQVELNKKYDEYIKGRDSYTALVRQDKEAELQSMQQRIQTYQQSAQEELQRKQAELMQPIVAKAKKAIEDVAKENGFTLIFEASALQYNAPECQDVLPLVKTKLGIKATPATTTK